MNRSRLLTGVAVVVAALGLANAIRALVGDDPPGPAPILVHFAAMAAMAYLLFAHVFPWFIGRGRPPGEVPAPDEPPIAQTRCGGQIGVFPLSAPLIKVLVYRDRIVLRPTLMGERTIMGNEITSVRPGRISFSSVLMIEHTNAGTATPVALNITADWIRAAITRIERTVPAGYEAPTGRPASFWTPGTILTALIALIGLALAIVGIVLTIINASAFTVALAVVGCLGTIQHVRKLLLARKGTPPPQ